MISKTSSWGLATGVLAGAMWGLVFLMPALADGFAPAQLTAGRYLAYGAIAAVLLAPSWRRLAPRLGRAEWRALAWLGLTGNILYYLCLAGAVQLGGVAMASLVIGLLPVTITVAGTRDHGAVPLRRLWPSLLCGVGGIACIGWPALDGLRAGAPSDALLGLLCALGALASWTVYAVRNSRWLARLHHVSAHEWSLLTGVATGALALLLAVPAFAFAPARHAGGDWLRFVAAVSTMALLCSVAGNALWNRASRLLPLTLVGQLVLFETLFALLYGFLWEGRWPAGHEILAMLLLGMGLLASALAHRGTAQGLAAAA
ncbi:DMT family transporter [uncultured Massilia sp.]|uniref:DMT family transporter n=1 Tax=uncultured Massilia sp. TaxID=169973 RepID=UPI0025EBEA3B|nr:DMT family transporter [uncultured Massilia sp.]